MDQQRFDEITRTLASTTTRRGVLRALAGLAIGGALGVRGARQAAAVCRAAGQACSAANPCCPNGVCTNGTCRCKPGLTKCGGACRNLKVDESNCGACGKVCAAGKTCSNGLCCTTGLTNCGGTCRNLKVEERNCGGCGKVCPDGQTCQNGVCTCPAGTTPIDGKCAIDCAGIEACEDDSCRCRGFVGASAPVCLQGSASCVELPQPCASNADCPTNSVCISTTCGPNGSAEGRCNRLCGQ